MHFFYIYRRGLTDVSMNKHREVTTGAFICKPSGIVYKGLNAPFTGISVSLLV